MGHSVTLVAGELDREGILIPDLHFKAAKVAAIHDRVVYSNEPYERIESAIFDIAGTIEGKLRKLLRSKLVCDLLIVPNVFSIPMHFPLAIALARTIEEFSLPTIARHHDFWWERERYKKSDLFPFFEKWFPPKLPTMKHIVINSIAQKSLKERMGIEALIIPDTFDFENKNLSKLDSFSEYFREDFGLSKKDIIFLQPTRIVPRKRIELSIKLISKLNLKEAILLISGTEGDEKRGYLKMLKGLVKDLKVRCKFIGGRVNTRRKIVEGKRIYSLWDCYKNCDFVVYPTQIEGFGNQFLETVYFKKPLILTPYPVYKSDIAPYGFEVIEMSEKVNNGVVKQIRGILESDEKKIKMTEKNFEIARKHFSYKSVEEKIKRIFKEMNLS